MGIELEIENNYVFRFCSYPNDIIAFFEKVLKRKISFQKEIFVKDYYLDKNRRIRQYGVAGSLGFELTEKKGDKAESRIEHTQPISKEVWEILSPKAQLVVNKKRHVFTIGNRPEDLFILDFIIAPMKITMAEVETKNDDLLKRLEASNLKKNNLSAWDYFRRKITFAGAPSSGKSTMARKLVTHLGLEFNGQVEQVTEYARTHIARYGIPQWYMQPLLSWGQERREEDASFTPIIISDAPTFLTYIYALFYLNQKPDVQSSFVLSKLYKDALSVVNKYTNIIFLKSKELKNDGVRYQTNDDAKKLYDIMKFFLDNHNIPYIDCDYSKDLEVLSREIFNINHIIGKEIVEDHVL